MYDLFIKEGVKQLVKHAGRAKPQQEQPKKEAKKKPVVRKETRTPGGGMGRYVPDSIMEDIKATRGYASGGCVSDSYGDYSRKFEAKHVHRKS